MSSTHRVNRIYDDDLEVIAGGKYNILAEGSKRSRKQTKRYEDEYFLKGSNNQHTKGRDIDPYERKY